MELMNVDCFSATTDMCSVLQGKYEPAALQELLENAYFLDPRYRDDYINDTETKYKLKEMAAVENGGSTASASVLGDEGQAVVLPAAKKKTRRLAEVTDNLCVSAHTQENRSR